MKQLKFDSSTPTHTADDLDRKTLRQSIAVRLEGGIGDHILGLRLLPFIRQAHPKRPIIVYSDAGGNPEQLEVAHLSPFVSHVIPVLSRDPSTITEKNMGELEALGKAFLDQIETSHLFFDAWGDGYFLEASRQLGVSPWEILAHRPELRIPASAKNDASQRLDAWRGHQFVGLNLSKFGVIFLKYAIEKLLPFFEALLANPKVVILFFFRTSFDFPHWPKGLRNLRKGVSKEEVLVYEALCQTYPRMVAIRDAPLTSVAAMLQGCRYFIGVDNGIKHLAWALNVPRTLICPELPPLDETLRWIPDYHRTLPMDNPDQTLKAHIEDALACGLG